MPSKPAAGAKKKPVARPFALKDAVVKETTTVRSSARKVTSATRNKENRPTSGFVTSAPMAAPTPVRCTGAPPTVLDASEGKPTCYCHSLLIALADHVAPTPAVTEIHEDLSPAVEDTIVPPEEKDAEIMLLCGEYFFFFFVHISFIHLLFLA